MIITAFIFIMVVFGLCFAAGVYLSKRLNSGSYWMAFRKLIFTVLVLIILAGGFYYGYHKALYSHKDTTHFTTTVNSESGTITTKEVALEYQLVDPNTSQEGATFSYGKLHRFEGNFPISELPSLIIRNDPANYHTECVFNVEYELQSRRGYKLYKMLLTYPHEASSMDLVNQLGNKLGFKVYSYDTELPWYRAVRNTNPIVFDINKTEDSSNITYTPETCTFHNISMQEILNQFNHGEIPHLGDIDDASGVKDKFNGQIAFNPNPENMKNELAIKLGVDIIPFQKKVKYFEVRKR